MKLALLPLQSIFFPGETVPLHIFEDRYKQLIVDCRKEAVTFGIPVYINDNMIYGTEVQLVEIVNTYDNGEMDVTCVARQVFRILSFEKQMKGKLYAGGTIQFLDSVNDAEKEIKQEVLDKIHELYELMGVPYTPLPLEKFNSYVLVHKMGLSFNQEYQLLQMPSERDRLLFMKSHLISTISMLSEVNRTKKTIEMNGNFKNFDPLDFEDFNL
ncbi:LON peptidase substrate-binding domain-containing protein [Zobellia laminariae]|uniref:LON peptidase substrate-binding domain-containing protein n=1 Tax=Zobellia barbeyronii TaxID=2748009 RepID=A0ABS5WGM3_9FLAO|nr:LON peptidase substrate-binding domain-containing protein [Zobellia barbeyronii]MBT2162103.1 LON peptidase substrate-binding domain-containing protein [Zobellia barbeyronii]MUH38538.1 ATP-dependent protease [Zobellia laminariae]